MVATEALSLLQHATAEDELDQADSITTYPAGTRIGAYTIVETLNQGGMGIVYRAKRSDGTYDKEVAIKTLGMSLEPIS